MGLLGAALVAAALARHWLLGSHKRFPQERVQKDGTAQQCKSGHRTDRDGITGCFVRRQRYIDGTKIGNLSIRGQCTEAAPVPEMWEASGGRDGEL
jgi:hypothetical protein